MSAALPVSDGGRAVGNRTQLPTRVTSALHDVGVDALTQLVPFRVLRYEAEVTYVGEPEKRQRGRSPPPRRRRSPPPRDHYGGGGGRGSRHYYDRDYDFDRERREADSYHYSRGGRDDYHYGGSRGRDDYDDRRGGGGYDDYDRGGRGGGGGRALEKGEVASLRQQVEPCAEREAVTTKKTYAEFSFDRNPSDGGTIVG